MAKGMITIVAKGGFPKTEAFLKRLTTLQIQTILNRHGEKGRAALAGATPTDEGIAANSWTYRVDKRGKTWAIVWSNTNTENGFPVAIMLQYGYNTGTGGRVAGRDYINPAIQPIFDQIVRDVWREVTRS